MSLKKILQLQEAEKRRLRGRQKPTNGQPTKLDYLLKQAQATQIVQKVPFIIVEPVKTISIPELVEAVAVETVPEAVAEAVPEAVPDAVPESVPESVAEAVPESVPEAVAEAVPEAVPEVVPETVPDVSQ